MDRGKREGMPETENNPVVDKVRELQRKLWVCAKQSRTRRFHALYDRIYRSDVLREAWRRVRSNGGAAGVDRETLESEFRRNLSNNGVWRPQYTPRIKKRTALLAKLREVFRRFMSQPAGDRVGQPDSARVGELLCSRTLEPLLFVCQRLGGKEDPAASDACPEAEGLRLAAVE